MYLLFEHVASVLQDRNKDVKIKVCHPSLLLNLRSAAIYRLL